MIHFVRQNGATLGHAAVFATILGPSSNSLAEPFIHGDAALLPCNETWALARTRSRN
jgi:hypothetical protein